MWEESEADVGSVFRFTLPGYMTAKPMEDFDASVDG